MPLTAQPPKDVMLVFPHPGVVAADFALSLVAAIHPKDTRIGGIADLRTGPFLTQARRDFAEMFLGSEFDWLWMVDADMSFNENTLPTLLAFADPDTVPVLGATCRTFTRQAEMIFTAYRADKDDQGRFGLTSLLGTEMPVDSLVKVDATGCACLLIHRTVFTRIDEHEGVPGQWFNEQVIDGRAFGEDLSFCLRAGAAGIPVYIHTGVQVGHQRVMQVGEVKP